MGWITLALRQETLDIDCNNLELRDLQLTNELRMVEKNKSHDQSIFNKNKKAELAEIKAKYNKVKDSRPVGDDGKIDTTSGEYATWQQEYALAKEEYEGGKLEIENYYSDINNENEEEATDKENEIKDEQIDVESQLESKKKESDVVKQQISTDIDWQKVKFGA